MCCSGEKRVRGGGGAERGEEASFILRQRREEGGGVRAEEGSGWRHYGTDCCLILA